MTANTRYLQAGLTALAPVSVALAFTPDPVQVWAALGIAAVVGGLALRRKASEAPWPLRLRVMSWSVWAILPLAFVSSFIRESRNATSSLTPEEVSGLGNFFRLAFVFRMLLAMLGAAIVALLLSLLHASLQKRFGDD